ncbi:MAG: TonB-dependent receptor [Cyclobacteriaceae bacterium]|nr:TonB-dependent receptor [Flammeovirgaceae bacterium]
MLCSVAVFAQNREISGTVTDAENGSPLPGANITIKGTSIGTATDVDGKYKLSVPSNASALVVSSIGYTTQEVAVGVSNVIDIKLAAASSELDEVIVTVGRGSQRTLTDTPLPVDNFTSSELRTSGQITFDKALQYRVPSFNTVNTPVNDATSLFDPYEIRNLGPSRTLILINGKRKNLTSLVYTQTGPGRGETGADLSAIPTDAIKRVEILRDGASAQYGSDAIAGVMNIILKDNYDATSVSLTTGSTVNYGGQSYGVNYNSGANFNNKGFINYHISFNRQEAAIRKDAIDALSDARDLTNNTPTSIAQVQNYLKRFPDGNNKNGTPDNTSAKFLLNGAIPVGANSEIYFNAAYVYRKSVSNANYRQPYWRIDHGLLHTTDPTQPDYTVDSESYGSPAIPDDPLTPADESQPASAIFTEVNADKLAGLYRGYIGYQPTFEGDLSDYNGTLGFRSQDINGWKQDMSITVGGNKMLFTVDNTVNRSLRKNSPVSFKPGGFSFNHIVGNMDFSKAVRDNVFVAIGSEFRTESWELIDGDTASYSGQGANSFPGFQKRNAIKATRFNIGAYLDVTWDITKDFLIGGTFRAERYSDFGNASVFKLTSRYKIGETITIRGSYSTGFRAPTLHQQYLSLSQASFSGGDIVITGLANNSSREARLLGVPKLKAEKSTNISFGFGFNPIRDLSITADYYSINIEDRIVYGTEVSNAFVNNISFFVNAAETQTSGLDIVANYRNISLGANKLSVNLAGNYTFKNELVGGFKGVNNRIGLPIFNQSQESLLTTSRPQYKFILGGDLTIGKLSINLNNTLFGPTKFNNADLSSDLRVEFLPKVLTDIGLSYNFDSRTSLSVTVQNLLNVFPEYQLKAMNAAGETLLKNPAAVKDQISYITFNGRYPVLTYDGSHFSQMGTTYLAQLSYKF